MTGIAVVGAAETTELGRIPDMSQIMLHALITWRIMVEFSSPRGFSVKAAVFLSSDTCSQRVFRRLLFRRFRLQNCFHFS